MKKLLLLLFFYSLNSFASTPCDNYSLSFKTNVIINPIKYVVNKSSKEIQEISHNKNQLSASSHVLGFIQSNVAIENSPSYLMVKNRFDGSVCGKVTEDVLKITLNPTIYISSDVINLPCIKEHTVNHELTHYKFHSDGVKKIENIAESIAVLYFKNTQYGMNEKDINDYLNGLNKKYIQSLNTIYQNYIHPLDSWLDEPNRSKHDLEMCPSYQQKELSKSLFN